MAITVKHKFVSAIPDAGDTTVVQPSNWNDDHQLTGTVPIANGGTGASDAPTALTNLGAYPASNPAGYGTGTVTSVSGTAPVNVATGTTTPVISLSTTGSGNVVLATGATQAHPTISDYETFTSTSAPSYAEGEIWYDSTQKALAYYNDVTNNTVHIGQEVQLKVINNTGSSIANGTPVYVTGTSSGQTYPNIALAKADAASTSAVLGLTNGTIASGATGYVCTSGLLTPCNTGSFTVGQVLYLSPYSAGQMMNTIPPTGYAVQIGVVAYANTPNGSIYVKQTTPLAVSASTITGTVAVNQGGTGVQTITGYVKGSGTSAFTGSSTIPNTDISGLGTMSTQNANAVTVTGGTIDNTVIGGTTPAAGTFTTITGQTEVLKGTGQNLLLQSQDFTTATWTKSNLTAATTSATTDPLGGLTADILTPNGTADAYCRQTITPVLSTSYGYSVYAKAGTGNWLRLRALFINNNTTDEAWFNLSTGTLGTVQASVTATITSVGNGWYRCALVGSTINVNSASLVDVAVSNADNTRNNTSGQTIYVWGAQLELSTTVGAYIATTSSVVYGTPTLSFSGVAGLGLQSDGSLYVSPAGTGALQAQATTSSTVGGNARGANAVDWQTTRNAANQVAGGSYSVVAGGANNGVQAGVYTVISGGANNTESSNYNFIGGGNTNYASGLYTAIVGGYGNGSSSQAGFYNFFGGGQNNTGTATAVVTTQATTSFTSGSTAVTLSGSNAAIKVGQIIRGTGIVDFTYVAAISGTSLTLSQNAGASGTPTLSFYTPHGVVVGGGNNQATGSYSFIGGGGDAGTAANRNQASGDYSVVVGGVKNTNAGLGSFIGAGGSNTSASFFGGNSITSFATNSAIVSGNANSAQAHYAFIGAGTNNLVNANNSAIAGGTYGTTRAIVGNAVFPACNSPIAGAAGVSQASLLVLGRQTTDATPTVLASDNNAPTTTNQVILPNNAAYYIKGFIVAGVTGAGNSKGYEVSCLIKRGANAAATSIVGAATVTAVYTDAGATTWAVTLTADTTNGGLAVTVTGQAATTIRWVAKLETTEMTY